MDEQADPLLDTLALADGVHAVRLSDGLVFLDIGRDSYFCLYHPLPAGVDDPASRAAIRCQLAAQGLVADCQVAPTRVAKRPTTPLWRERPPLDAPSPRLRDRTRFVRALLAAAWRFHRSSLAQMIAQVQHTRQETPEASLPVVTARFDRLCRWLPFRIQCLFRSFFLLHFLSYYGLGADWVFGVSLFPFHAHCWLADGDLLLGERIGRVEGFAIIFKIECACA